MKRKRAFTLVEILVVLAIVALLAAILLPVFASVRGAARNTACASNLHQLGLAMTQYATDYDHYPHGVDPADKVTPQIWDPVASAQGFDFGGAPLLPQVMASYVKEPAVWRCPADSGFSINDITSEPMDALPTCFAKYGMSYFYRTEVTILNLQEEHLAHPAETNILSDGDGHWHGSAWSALHPGQRYNVLFGDGHVKNIDRDAFDRCWATSLL